EYTAVTDGRNEIRRNGKIFKIDKTLRGISPRINYHQLPIMHRCEIYKIAAAIFNFDLLTDIFYFHRKLFAYAICFAVGTVLFNVGKWNPGLYIDDER